MKTIILTSVFALLFSCSTQRIASDAEYTQSESYQSRNLISQSFVKKSEHNMDEKAIQYLLTSRIARPKNVKLTIVKMRGWGVESDFFAETDDKDQQKNQNYFLEIVNKSKNVEDIAVIPSFLMPSEITISNLRDTAALMQSHYMLLIKSNSYSDHKYKMFGPNEYLVSASLEVALMDIKTGVIPYTAVVTGKSKYKKKDKDFNENDFRKRAEKLALNDAYKKIQEDILTYFK